MESESPIETAKPSCTQHIAARAIDVPIRAAVSCREEVMETVDRQATVHVHVTKVNNTFANPAQW
jgi:hypothetical protein